MKLKDLDKLKSTNPHGIFPSLNSQWAFYCGFNACKCKIRKILEEDNENTNKKN